MSHNDHTTKGQPPTCIALVICNEIIEDARTRNKTLVSLFNSIGTTALPTVHPRMFVMGSFTADGVGLCIDRIHKHVFLSLLDRGYRVVSLSDDGRQMLQDQIALFFGYTESEE